MIAAIPSPGSNAIHIGPLQLRAYGVMIALGVIAAVWLGSRRAEASRRATAEDVSAIALWGVPAGVIGARIYHLATDWKNYRGRWPDAFKIWSGGLGIWGGIFFGTLAGLYVAHKRGLRLAMIMDIIAPGLPLAQGIGRIGNWFNQELFGRPLDAFWAVRIDPQYRPAQYANATTFHPTFLYELVWDVGICVALLVIDRRRPLRPGKLFALYVALYTFGRFFIERMRTDFASKVLGLRINEWTSVLVCAVAVAYLVLARPRPLDPIGEPVATDELPSEADSQTETETESIVEEETP
ncbi:MAG: prolipoprotein diacylglyceryl transferase [Acidimicrobiia bacterium]